jgi:hypothetical protein
MDNALKAISLEEKERQVWQTWDNAYPSGEEAVPQSIHTHVVETFEDHVIVWFEDAHFSVPYSRDGDTITFAARDQWEKVMRDQRWLPAKNILKAISRTNDTLTVGNYIILFGDDQRRDLEGLASPHKNADGSLGEYFTADTVLDSPFTKAGKLDVDFEHGIGRELYGKSAPGPDDILGVVDWSSAKADKNGVWVKRALDMHNEYMQFIEELIDGGVIGTSSEAIPEGIQRTKSGEILIWPIKKDTLTFRPMEWRNAKENVLRAAKALGLQIPTEPAPAETEPEADPSAASVANARADIILFQVKSRRLE